MNYLTVTLGQATLGRKAFPDKLMPFALLAIQKRLNDPEQAEIWKKLFTEIVSQRKGITH